MANYATILEWSKGNPGAMSFLMHLRMLDEESVEIIEQKLLGIPKLRGAALYVLFNDLCDRNFYQVEKLCRECPDDLLEEACLKQDYSGIHLVANYLKL